MTRRIWNDSTDVEQLVNQYPMPAIKLLSIAWHADAVEQEKLMRLAREHYGDSAVDYLLENYHDVIQQNLTVRQLRKLKHKLLPPLLEK